MDSPKQRWLKGPLVKAHLDITDSATFQEAAQATLAQMVMDLPDTVEPQTAIAGYHRIIGARQYLRALMAFSQVAEPPKERVSYNLDHQLK